MERNQGIMLRTWAERVLGRFYTRTLLTTDHHLIVQEGPYRSIRHPGYSGSLLVWIGAGMATSKLDHFYACHPRLLRILSLSNSK